MMKMLKALIKEKPENIKIFELRDEQGQEVPMKIQFQGTKIDIFSLRQVESKLVLSEKFA